MSHSRFCRYSPLFPHCNCGESERNERIDRLEERIGELEHEIDKLKTCDTCSDSATRHVCAHHCYRE